MMRAYTCHCFRLAAHGRSSLTCHSIVWMHRAPEELGLLLRHQPCNTLNNFFRFLAQSIRFIDPRDPAGSQFLKVVKALIRFGLAYLAQNAAVLNLSTSHPLYRLFDSLARVDEHELLQASWKGWKVGCESWYEMMDDPAAWSANVDYLNIANLGGCSASELPTNMGEILDKTLKRYEADGLHTPKYTASLWNRAIYTELISNSATKLGPQGDTLVTCEAARPRGLVACAGTEVRINANNTPKSRKALDECIRHMTQTIAVMEEEHGHGSPLVIQFIREVEYGMCEAGEMGIAADMAKLLYSRSPSG